MVRGRNETTKRDYVKPYNRGALACILGRPLDGCPKKKCALYIEAWCDGWHSQKPKEFFYEEPKETDEDFRKRIVAETKNEIQQFRV